MKKFYLISILAILCQPLFSQVKVGMKLGADFSIINPYDMEKNERIPIEDDEEKLRRLISPRLGFFVDVPFNDFLFIRGGSEIGIKGYKFDFVHEIKDNYEDTKDQQVILQLDIPILLGYKYEMDEVKLIGMIGPVITNHLYATWLYNYKGDINNIHQSIGTELTDDFKPTEFSVKLEAGVEVDRFGFSVSYTKGLSNILPDNDWDLGYKSNIIAAGVSIKFGNVDGRRRGYRRK